MLRFTNSDQFHSGTVGSWVREKDAQQLKNYILGQEVQQKIGNDCELQAHLVIIVGSRHILLWDMNQAGTLAEEPRLIGGLELNGILIARDFHAMAANNFSPKAKIYWQQAKSRE
ncbi:uncharacterized protein Z518_00252 [Rhinocladiella mackenziei CBS 650.93]|uniref:Uncharacterized protein n=1 Tax=Rhinocladiella mackenziei CBS 650.93 TaxID=1442369 RepID=A0A0D2HET7_9EURO|nr:uncharacterized protein Z518_00252 [Rhinocladiella mackenziei CBS 650.93]KIX09173.1 hypothetical protein Z518_00252 [Rhinocladiella mackenziei CBS 650.93]